MTRFIQQFQDAMRASGITPPDSIIADGKLHRFSTNGKLHDTAGWYVLHEGQIPAGAFGDWRTGLTQNWRVDLGRPFTLEERTAYIAKKKAIQIEYEADKQRGYEQAAQEASKLWELGIPATAEQSYLKRKQIQPHGTKVSLKDGRLLVPMCDGSGKLWNLELIIPNKPSDGSPDKKGLYRGKRIGCFYTIGKLKPSATLLLCEGFATGASLYEATQLPIVVAFNAGNLLPVAEAIQYWCHDRQLIICADDDYQTTGNPGITKAKEAALAVGGMVVVPDFGIDRPAGATDFNDLHQIEGLLSIQQLMASFLESIGVMS
jgi:putative DNA primase/helicase